MRVNFDESNTNEFIADLCIVGSGAAGITCALEFEGNGLKVILLEGGLQSANPSAVDIHRAFLDGMIHSGIHKARERVVGGTTTTWGGQALPFMEEDFLERSWVANSGWPFDRSQLNEYYNRSIKTLGLNQADPEDIRPWESANIQVPVFEPETLQLIVTRWCREPNFAKLYGAKISSSENVLLLENANVTELHTNADGTLLQSASICSLSGRKGRVSARHFILAGGSIETARLMLSSRGVWASGIGNSHDFVGRYFQDHVAAIVGLIVHPQKAIIHDVFEPFYLKGYKYLPRLRLSPTYAAQKKLLHASVQVVFSSDRKDPTAPFKSLAKKLRGNHNGESYLALASQVIANPGESAYAFSRMALKKRGVSSLESAVWLECHSEQAPDPFSRILLDASERDELGMPRVRLDWRVSEATYDTIRETAFLSARQFEFSGLGRVVLDDWILNDDSSWRNHVGDVYHQCGTTRMGISDRTGVVGPDCSVHGVANLFVAGAAVFPTSSFSNPTMTAIALSIRLCDTIKKHLV